MIQKNDLYDYKNRYIFQDDESFKFSLDSLLLAEYARKYNKGKVVDMCAGNMSIGLVLSTYSNNQITGFEIQKDIYDLGVKSIEYNHLDNVLEIINDDIKNIGNYFESDSIDALICNPPFFEVNDLKVINPKEAKAIARHEIYLKLEDIFAIASKYLKNGGSLLMVHRATRLDEIIHNAVKYNVKVKEIKLISTKKNNDPSIVLIRCVKNSQYNLKISGNICVEGLSTFQGIFKE